MVSIWDTRQKKEHIILKTEDEEMMAINRSQNYVTLSCSTKIKNYDLKYLKTPKNSYESEDDINDLLWCEFDNQVLLTVGGKHNRGILQLFDEKLHLL